MGRERGGEEERRGERGERAIERDVDTGVGKEREEQKGERGTRKKQRRRGRKGRGEREKKRK